MSEDIKREEQIGTEEGALPEEPVDPREVDPETGKLYPVCPDCGRRHPVDPEDERDAKGWFFHEVVGATKAEEDEIWSTLESLKKGRAGTKDLAMKMIEEAHKAAEAGNLPKAYLWALITGKVFGLYGV
jgi:hypothetical protein